MRITIPRLHRFWAMVVKEFVQMRRDRLTFGMMIGIPLIQLVLFGFAINSDPKHLPTAVLAGRQRSSGPHAAVCDLATAAISTLFARSPSEQRSAPRACARRRAVRHHIPENFGRELLRGDRPALLVEADATDPAATSNALGSAAPADHRTRLDRDLRARSPSACEPGTRRSARPSPATTRKPSRNTTSCPGSWASC